MMVDIDAIEQSAIGLLLRASESSYAMKELCKREGLSIKQDQWSAVLGLLDAALERFKP